MAYAFGLGPQVTDILVALIILAIFAIFAALQWPIQLFILLTGSALGIHSLEFGHIYFEKFDKIIMILYILLGAYLVSNIIHALMKIINYSEPDQRVRFTVKVSISYKSDIGRALLTMTDIGGNTEGVLHEPSPKAYFVALSSYSIDLSFMYGLRITGLNSKFPTTYTGKSSVSRIIEAISPALHFY